MIGERWEVAENLLDHLVVIDKCEQFRHSPDVGTNARVSFPDLLDAFAPLGRRDAPRLVFPTLNKDLK